MRDRQTCVIEAETGNARVTDRSSTANTITQQALVAGAKFLIS